MSDERRGDFELLDAYARTHDQDAFAELVARHVDLVYTSARRQVRDPHVAEDIAQTVFVTLARKAASIGPRVLLGGWLLNATRFAARDALRQQFRRRRHETVAAQQRTQQLPGHEPHSDSDASTSPEQREQMERLDSLLDAAMARLGAANRDAVCLRFFQHKSFRDIGQELGIGEQAAKQRVSRALRRLRGILAQSGLEMPLEGLGSSLGARAILPAPPGLAKAIAAGALHNAVGVASTAALTKGGMVIVGSIKAKIGIVVVVLLLLSAGTVGVRQWIKSGGDRVVVLKSGAALPGGGAPAPAPVSWGMGVRPVKAAPYNGGPITGTVLDGQGKPVADAQVLFALPGLPVSVYGPFPGSAVTSPSTKTSSDGRFSFTPSQKPVSVVVSAAGGYAAARIIDPATPLSISIQPWARIEGTVRSGSKPVPRARVQVAQYGDQVEWDQWQIVKQRTLTCDDNGHFVMDRVVPGHNVIGRVISANMLPVRFINVDLPAGKTTTISVGGNGRTVIGHIPVSGMGFNSRFGHVILRQPQMKLPPDWNKLSEEQKQKLQKAWWESPEFQAWRQNASVAQIDIGRDGIIRAEDIPPGDYDFQLQLGELSRGSYFVETAGWGTTHFTVPPITAALLDEPLDIGEVQVQIEKRIGVGEAVPEITGDSLDGSSAKLSDFRGKYVLLHLWTTAQRDTMDTIHVLHTLLDRFGDDARVTVVGLSTNDSSDDVRKAIKDEQMTWPQILLHGWNDSRLPRPYTLSPAHLFLIDPDGHLVAKNADVAGMFGVLAKLLPPAASPKISVDRQKAEDSSPWHQVAVTDNLARTAAFSLVDGGLQPGSARLDCLHDGLLPTTADDPAHNFYFQMGTLEGRFKIDLDSSLPIAQINTYSRHKSDRGPQVYKLYASDGADPHFNPDPKIGTDPATCGWKLIATVDTRPQAVPAGGRYAVHLSDPSGTLCQGRYLLFETFVTETADTWGHTFYSEMEVIRGR